MTERLSAIGLAATVTAAGIAMAVALAAGEVLAATHVRSRR
ncbi:hypothetical protein [Prescottella agglutinans]|uniref:Uncharacterized protein n=1 Tax=Prescottella agglutinans TaxID=1644129 RepID=A0ABT6MIB9_9NOCA|nr:hypothetical protein [Prescottella agglutinans]MDH6284055.1 hypothetical protein [Prescottella agglutinans]